jgi:hypothetical protein
MSKNVNEPNFLEYYSWLVSDLDVVEELNREIINLLDSSLKKKTRELVEEVKPNEDDFNNMIEVATMLARMIKKPDNYSVEYKVRPESEKLVPTLMRISFIRNQSELMIRTMTIVYLVARFESYLCELLEKIYYNHPEILNSKDKNLSYEKIFESKKIEEITGQIIKKEIESIKNLDIKEVFLYLKKKFNIDLTKLDNVKEFYEIFYRRNIIIHNEGYENEIYLIKTGKKRSKEGLVNNFFYISNCIKLLKEYSKLIAENFEEKFGS